MISTTDLLSNDTELRLLYRTRIASFEIYWDQQGTRGLDMGVIHCSLTISLESDKLRDFVEPLKHLIENLESKTPGYGYSVQRMGDLDCYESRDGDSSYRCRFELREYLK